MSVFTRAPTPAPAPAVPRRSLLRRLVVVVVGLFTVGVLIFAVTAVRVWQVGREDHRPHADAILVLGAAQYDGRPSPTLRARLDHAALLYREGIAPRIVTVGGKEPADVYTEAEAGARYLESVGVPAAALIVVGQGRDTLQSLRAADVILRAHGWHSVVLVTDPWHELRSRAMARDLGLTTATSPTHTGPASQGRLTEVRYILRETTGYLYYRIVQRP